VVGVVPAFGQVDGEVAVAVAGDAGGDGDQVAADGRAAALGVERPGERAGGAGQVGSDRGQGEPRGIGGEVPYGRWASGPSFQSAKTCSMIACSRTRRSPGPSSSR
jgi:hypothetical protein